MKPIIKHPYRYSYHKLVVCNTFVASLAEIFDKATNYSQNRMCVKGCVGLPLQTEFEDASLVKIDNEVGLWNVWPHTQVYLSHATRKPDFGVCGQIRLKPAWSADKTS